MAKGSRKQQVVKSGGKQGHLLEETFDDSLLPDVNEIEKLTALDPNILQWLKDRAEKEQEFRHSIVREKIDLVKKNDRGTRWINYSGLFFSFMIIGGGMFISYLLIINSFEVIGTIFTGVILLGIVSIFMSKVKSNNQEKTPR